MQRPPFRPAGRRSAFIFACVATIAVPWIACSRIIGRQPDTPGTMSTADLVQHALARKYRADTSRSDEQILSFMRDGQRRYGTRATRIQPWEDLEQRDEHFGPNYQAVARILAEEDYPKLGIRRGTNFLFVRREGSTWEGVLIAIGDGTGEPVLVRMRMTRTAHAGSEKDIPSGSARWLWRYDDEEAWVRCGKGCCIFEGAIDS